jgi:hypothetical protein
MGKFYNVFSILSIAFVKFRWRDPHFFAGVRRRDASGLAHAGAGTEKSPKKGQIHACILAGRLL